MRPDRRRASRDDRRDGYAREAARSAPLTKSSRSASPATRGWRCPATATCSGNEDAFAVGTTLTVPLHGYSSRDVLDELTEAPYRHHLSRTRKPTLDVYLQPTGDSLAA